MFMEAAVACAECADTMRSGVVALTIVAGVVLAIALAAMAVRFKPKTPHRRTLLVTAVALLLCVLLIAFANPSSFKQLKLLGGFANTSKESQFPESAVLEDPTYFEHARREILAAIEKVQHESNELVIKSGDDWNSQVVLECPFLLSLLQSLPNVVNASVHVLRTNSTSPSRDSCGARYCIPLQSPESERESYLCVNGQRYELRCGVGVLFDASLLHSYRNASSNRLVLLTLDVRRASSFLPDLAGLW